MPDAGQLEEELKSFMADPRRRTNPYDMYRRLQDVGALRFKPMRAWLVTRYADVTEILRRPDTSCRVTRDAAWRTTSRSGVPLLLRHLSLVRIDPPDHTRIRNHLVGMFGPKAVHDLRDRIEELARELLEPLVKRGEMELFADYAYPLSLGVIAELFGIPKTDFPLFRETVRGVSERFGVNQIRSSDARRRGDEGEAALVEYIRRLIAQRRAEPGGDLLTQLVTATDGDLSQDELVANCTFLIGAGHETTAKLICNAVVGLLQDARLSAGLGDLAPLGRHAVDELCRWDPTVQVVPRCLGSDIELDGTRIAAGQIVLGFLGAANHDGRCFTNADILDLDRPNNAHLTFGAGIHGCLGAALGRAELEIGLNVLLERLPDIRLAHQGLGYGENLTLRGPQQVPLRWSTET